MVGLRARDGSPPCLGCEAPALRPNCLDDETLAGYADGSLGKDGRAAVDDHVDRCHTCRRLLAAVGASSDTLEKAPIAGDVKVR
jgi:hypothetical protein